MRVEKDLTINAPVEKVYTMWTEFENFPSFMTHVESVTKTGDKTYHWKAKIGPVEREWDGEVQAMIPNRTVTWHSTTGADNAGAVTLSERGHITEMHVVISYEGSWFETLGEAVTRTLSRDVEQDLERFRLIAEGHDPSKASGGAGPSRGQSGAQGSQATYSRDRSDLADDKGGSGTESTPS